MKVSVIIPFYRVEQFIGRCAVSLLTQTMDDVEFIFVDDASPDRSRSILEHILARDPERKARILTHPENKGLPAARNTGLAVAEGKYIYHCDSDDWVEKDLLERMVHEAESQKADYVYCDFWLQFEEDARYMKNPSYTAPEQMVKEGFLAGLMKYNVWNKLVLRDLYGTDIRFPEGHGMGEDMTMILLALNARRVAHVPHALYHYVKQNSNAFSNTFSEKHLEDIRFNTGRILEALDRWTISDKERYIDFFKLNVKLPFLLSDDPEQYRLWEEWFPEANRSIPLNRHLPGRTRWVQRMAAKGRFGLVKLYGLLINNLYYRLRYRNR